MKKITFVTIIFSSVFHLAHAQWTNGTNISNTNSGNVGIGTAGPFKHLHVQGGNIVATTTDFNASGTGSALFLGQDGTTGNVYSLVQAAVNGPNSPGTLALNPSGGFIGVGTTSPYKHLHVLGGNMAISTTDFNASGTGSALFLGQDGTTGNVYSFVQAAINGPNSPGILSLNPSGGSIAIGTTDPKGYKLAVNGNAIATSMTVKLYSAWPDYVFKKDYQLPSLAEVKTYIDQNQHLPEMPSAQEIAKDGLNLGEMNKLLMKKVEELTLYLIEQSKRIDEQQKQINKLSKIEN